MAVTVRVPALLRELADGKRIVTLEAATVAGALAALREQHPVLVDRLCEPDGRPRSFLHLFVGDQEIGQVGGLAAPLRDGDVIYIVPAEAGGAPRRTVRPS